MALTAELLFAAAVPPSRPAALGATAIGFAAAAEVTGDAPGFAVGVDAGFGAGEGAAAGLGDGAGAGRGGGDGAGFGDGAGAAVAVDDAAATIATCTIVIAQRFTNPRA